MNKLFSALILSSSSLFLIPPAFAVDTSSTSDSEGPACATIAKACLAAGYTREENATKAFWRDCMKPALLGSAVAGVTVDQMTIDTCRTDKVAELQKELMDIQNSMPKASTPSAANTNLNTNGTSTNY